MLNLALIKGNKIPILLTILSCIFYFIFAYDLERTDHTKLIALYVALFILFYKLIQSQKHKISFLIIIAVLFRAIFILAVPNLSQDFYRFIWDGRMILQGFNPYLYTPKSFITNNKFPIVQAQELYIGMRELNASHFTNYPPINQLCFIIAGIFSGKSIIGSVVVLRLLIIASDIGTLYYGIKLLKKLKLPTYNIFWFTLNPFIIIELTGNLHFESTMIFFLVWSLYLLHSGKWKMAAFILTLSIGTKLIPLMFLPLFFWWFINNKDVKNDIKNTSTKQGVVKLTLFYSIIGLSTLLLFSPFFSIQFVENYSKTVGLWFSNFEFNASIYYLAREIGYLFRGWNEIAVIGKILPILALLFILYRSLIKKNNTTKMLIVSMLFAFTFYLFTSTTVHPWYISTLLILSIFTHYKFPLVWSFIIIISYLAYANTNNTENLWIISFEYLIIYGFFIWEVFIKQKRPPLMR